MSFVSRVFPALFFKFALVLTLFTSAACAQSDGALGGSGPTHLVIESQDGEQRFKVELAQTPEERAIGLMYREQMAEDAGMLFDFGESQLITMWMKNTLIPLDMAFIDEHGVIKHITTDTTPRSLDPISSEEPVIAVLEVNGGVFERLGIKEGDKVRHPWFKK